MISHDLLDVGRNHQQIAESTLSEKLEWQLVSSGLDRELICTDHIEVIGFILAGKVINILAC